jgi:hypothetical protein
VLVTSEPNCGKATEAELVNNFVLPVIVRSTDVYRMKATGGIFLKVFNIGEVRWSKLVQSIVVSVGVGVGVGVGTGRFSVHLNEFLLTSL